MEHHPEHWGRSRHDHVSRAVPATPISHTQQPIVTGTSVLAVRYQDGIMMATDCLASYGSLARFRDMERMATLGETTLMGTSGDVSDFQFTVNMLQQHYIKEMCYDDGHVLSPRQWFTALAAVMYKRRSELDPLWNSNVVAGVDRRTGEKFLGCCNMLGTRYEDASIATGFGAYLAQPILREALERRAGVELTEAEAQELLERCMTVLWYRDARSADKIQLAKVTAEGVIISPPYTLTRQNWAVATYRFEQRNP